MEICAATTSMSVAAARATKSAQPPVVTAWIRISATAWMDGQASTATKTSMSAPDNRASTVGSVTTLSLRVSSPQVHTTAHVWQAISGLDTQACIVSKISGAL